MANDSREFENGAESQLSAQPDISQKTRRIRQARNATGTSSAPLAPRFGCLRRLDVNSCLCELVAEGLREDVVIVSHPSFKLVTAVVDQDSGGGCRHVEVVVATDAQPTRDPRGVFFRGKAATLNDMERIAFEFKGSPDIPDDPFPVTIIERVGLMRRVPVLDGAAICQHCVWFIHYL